MIDFEAQHPASSLACYTLGPKPRASAAPLTWFHVEAGFGTS